MDLYVYLNLCELSEILLVQKLLLNYILLYVYPNYIVYTVYIRKWVVLFYIE